MFHTYRSGANPEGTAQQYGGECTLLYKEVPNDFTLIHTDFAVPLDPPMLVFERFLHIDKGSNKILINYIWFYIHNEGVLKSKEK